MQNLRQSKKGFPFLKKIKIQVFATVTLFHLKHHKALVYSARDFPVFPPTENSGDDESNDTCRELLPQVLTRPLSRRKVVTVGVHTTGAVRKSSATRPPWPCPRRPRASPARGARPGWWTGSSRPRLHRRSNQWRSAPPSHTGQLSSRAGQTAARTCQGQGTSHGGILVDIINLGEGVEVQFKIYLSIRSHYDYFYLLTILSCNICSKTSLN